MDDIAVSVKNLYKEFKLPHERKNSLKEWVVHFKRPTYERLQALSDINFEVKKGEFFGIVGRNGSGKSTLLKIIAGIYQPTSGRVQVHGSLTPFIELGIGFNPELTGRENVFLNGAILGLTRKEVKAKYHEIVAFAELQKFMDQKLKNYSSGMQVRLAFSIAIQAHNDILLIDEVLAVGDAAFQRKCFGVFKDIKNHGKTVIFVTHDMGAVQEYCDRAMMIADSHMLIIGKPREVALRYEVANSASEQSVQTGPTKSSRPLNPPLKLLNLKTRSPKKATSHFERGEDILVDIDFRVHNLNEPVQFNLFLVRPDGRYLAGINTTSDLGQFKPQEGKNRITCRLKAGQLTKGDYFVNAAVYNHASKLIDVLDTSYDIKVPIITILEGSSTQNGEFYISGSWSQAD
ncbi:ABC transporter ATP-binding protein [Candidatus Saccharibacteria bacterium]|nr:ABC transporter ATP-binding protein [Candidatus Saccharibacteria bacterium]